MSVATETRGESRRAVGDVSRVRRSPARSASPSPPASPTGARTGDRTCRCRSKIDGHVDRDAAGQHRRRTPRRRSRSQPFTLANPSVHGVVRAGTDPMPADNTFDFVLTPSQSVSVLVDRRRRRTDRASICPRRWRSATRRRSRLKSWPAGRVTPQMLERRAAVVVNDAALPPALAGGALKRYVERGGGLLVAVGEHTTWPANDADMLPGQLGQVGRPHGRPRRHARLPRLQPSGIRSLQGATQRRLLCRPRAALPRHSARTRRPRARALR